MAYNQWEITNPKFSPARRNIQSITNANPALVTTINPHGYITGTIVRLVIPIQKGMQDADNLTGNITVTGTNTFTINIDTTQMAPFIEIVDPTISTLLNVCAQVQPIGENNDTLNAAAKDTGRV